MLVVGLGVLAATVLTGTSGSVIAAESSATTYVSLAGNDGSCARGDRTRPCASFQRAFAVSRCGDAVEVADGAYPRQEITDSKSVAGCVSHVRFGPAPGARVAVDEISLGGESAQNGPDWIELQGFTVVRSIGIWSGAQHVRLVGLDGGSFYIQGASDVTLTQNDWGPCASDTGGGCQGQQNFIDASYGKSYPTRDIVIDGDRIHDYSITPGSDSHFECLYVTGANGPVTIRRSHFFNCETYGIYFTGYLESHGYGDARFLVEDNIFGRTCCFGDQDRGSAINLGGAPPILVHHVLIRSNTFIPGQGVVREGGDPGEDVRVVGNVLGAADCLQGVFYAANIAPKACGDGDRTRLFGYALIGSRLAPVAAEAAAIRFVFERASEGMRTSEIARLGRREHPTVIPPGGWTARGVSRMLAEALYVGGGVGAARTQPGIVSYRRFVAARTAPALARSSR